MAGIAQLLLVARAGPLAEGLLGLLTTIPGIEVVAQADSVASALVVISEPRPAAVILVSGPFAEETPAIVRRLDGVLAEGRCIVLADDVEQQRAARSAGADAVLLEGCRPADLVATIRSLLVAQPTVKPEEGSQWAGTQPASLIS